MGLFRRFARHRLGRADADERDSLSEHGSLAVTGAPAALAWLAKRLSSTTDPTGCTRTNVLSAALTPAGLKQFPATARGILISLLGLPIGPTF